MTPSHTPAVVAAPLAFLAGGGEMGERTRAFDWSKSPLGPVTNWPQSLKTALRIMLNSRYPMFLAWGHDLTFFYNDAYTPVLGKRHPTALGQPAALLWSEIWSTLGPQAEAVMQEGRASWSEEQLLLMERNQFLEETYFTYSYSPIPDDGGGVGGVFCACTEDTHRVLSQRRLRILRALAEQTAPAKSAPVACETAARTLAEDPHDLPFALLYLLEDGGRRAELAGLTGLGRGAPASPIRVDLDDHDAPWPFRQVAETGKAADVADLIDKFGSLPGGAWPDPPQRAIVLPLSKPGQAKSLAGFAVAGVSARLPFDDDYKGFTELLAGHVAAAVANARAYEEEKRRAEALAELDRAKTAFFSNVSHEFRTPLTLMLGPVEELLARSHTDLPPAAAGQLEVVNRNGLRLLRLVNSLLDFSRIEAGRVRASFQPTDLATFTADLASNFRSACERAGLRLMVDCPPLTEPVYVDREMWEKVVLNLLSNAFKFTFDGGITVSLVRNGGVAELRVKDTGTGIPAEEMPRLFERFHRIEKVRGRTHEGSGIGLALVQELVKLHGGSITAESVMGEGTTFAVTVPLGTAHLPPDQIGEGRTAAGTGTGATPYVEEALRWLPDVDETLSELPSYAEPLPTPHRPPKRDKEDDRPRVLLADDNADMRQYVVRLLDEQFRVEAVPDGEAALRAARDRPPDLVLTDVMMPKLNGFGLLKELRADPRTSGLPVIMLSARAGEESRVEGMEAGADDYLVKPFGARELLARVTAHLQMARLRRESERAVRQREERFRALVSASSDVVYLMSADWSEMRSLEGREFIADTHEPSRTWLETYIDPQDRPLVTQAIAEAVRTKSVFQLEHRVRRGDGTLGWAFSRAVPLLGTDGEIVEWVGAASDVTARKRAEEELQKERDRLRVTLASIGDAVITTDTEGRITFLNGVAESLTGWTNAEASGQPLDAVFRIVNEDTRQPVENPALRSLRDGVVVGLANHTALIRKDGTERPIDDSAAPVRDGRGHVVGCVLVFRDVSERRRVENEVRRNHELFRLVHQIGKIGHWEWNSLTNENKWSPEIEALYGLEPGTFGGTYEAWAGLVHPDDLPRAEEDVRRALETGRYFTEFRVVWPDGSVHWLEARASVFKDGHDKPVRITGVNMDITDRKRHEEALRDADRRKDEFLATLAHELRNPLAPIRNGLQVLGMAGGDRNAFEQARTMMDRQLTQLVRLVDDLMDVSRISRGKIELRREQVSLAAVVNTAVETSRPLIEQMGHELTVTLPQVPVVVDADLTRLAQVFLNLLNNSAKYTERGGRIRLTAERQGSDVVVSVKDNGIGIAAEQLPRLFEMFSQLDHALEKSQGGLGIGLTLVKRLVEMHGGRIEARSEGLGKGSEFVVRLPVVVEASRPQATRREESSALQSSLRILVVDDNRDGADSLAMMLKIMGNDTRTAYDGEEAIKAAVEFRPDVILLDIGLPKLTGYEACRRIRQQRGGTEMVIIAQTGWGQEEDRQRTHEAGFDHHMVKPVDPTALMKLLAELQAAKG